MNTVYHFGKGVPQAYATAMKWYRLAAAQEHADAQSLIGAMYDKGEGIPQDDTEAVSARGGAG